MVVEAWAVDWQARFRAIVQKMGHEDTFAFVMSRKGESFGEMFRAVRSTTCNKDADFLAFAHLEELFYVDAERHGRLREAVMESLVRSLREHLRDGWNHGKRLRERRIDALGKWPIPHFVSHLEWDHHAWKKLQNRLWDELERSDPSDDWCPADFEDPVIQLVVSRIWPHDKVVDET
jgi:hypothetical protein